MRSTPARIVGGYCRIPKILIARDPIEFDVLLLRFRQ